MNSKFGKLLCRVNKSNPKDTEVRLGNGKLLYVYSLQRVGKSLRVTLPSESYFIDFVNVDRAWLGEREFPRPPYRNNGSDILTLRLNASMIMDSSVLDPDGNTILLEEFKISGGTDTGDIALELLIPEECFELLEYGRDFNTGRLLVTYYSQNLNPHKKNGERLTIKNAA
jgi:hypothetical protein